jgi:hypothetical protein
VSAPRWRGKRPPAWRAADVARARGALDHYALDLRERVTRGDWRVAWRELVHARGADKVRELLLDHCRAEVARCRESHGHGESTLSRVRADHDAAVARGFPVPITNALERVKYHERSQAKMARRIRAAERLAELAAGDLPAEVVGCWPLGAEPPA